MPTSSPQTAVLRCIAALAGRKTLAPGDSVELRDVKLMQHADLAAAREWHVALPGHAVVSLGYEAMAAGSIGAIGLRVSRHDADSVGASGRLTLRCPEIVRVNLTGEGADPVSGIDVLLDAARRLGPANIKGRAVEVSGSGLGRLWMDERAVLAQAAALAGFAFAFVVADERVLALVREETSKPFETWLPQPGASYAASVDVAPGRLLSQALLDDGTVYHAGELAGTRVSRIIISGAAARATPLERISELLRGRSIAGGVELVVQPCSPADAERSSTAGTLADLERFGATILKHGEDLPSDAAAGQWIVHTCPLDWHDGVERKDGARLALVSGALASACALAGEFKHPADALAVFPGDSKVSTRRPAQG